MAKKKPAKKKQTKKTTAKKQAKKEEKKAQPEGEFKEVQVTLSNVWEHMLGNLSACLIRLNRLEKAQDNIGHQVAEINQSLKEIKEDI